MPQGQKCRGGVAVDVTLNSKHLQVVDELVKWFTIYYYQFRNIVDKSMANLEGIDEKTGTGPGNFYFA